MSASALCRSGGHEAPCARDWAFWLARAAGLGQLWLSVRWHLRSSIGATKVLRKIDMGRRDGASEPSGAPRAFKESRPLRPTRPRTRTRSARGSRPEIQTRSPKLGAHAPSPAPRPEQAGCCYVSLVERFLRRPRGRGPARSGRGFAGLARPERSGTDPVAQIDRAVHFSRNNSPSTSEAESREEDAGEDDERSRWPRAVGAGGDLPQRPMSLSGAERTTSRPLPSRAIATD